MQVPTQVFDFVFVFVFVESDEKIMIFATLK